MIDQLNLKGFTNFSESEFVFSKGINVFIGKNGTGKTHILKNIAAIIDANNEIQLSHAQSKERFENLIAEKLLGYYKPDQLGRLVKKGQSNSIVTLKSDKKDYTYTFSSTSKVKVNVENNEHFKITSSLYIPPREMFSTFEGFLTLIDKREISFDETYVKFAKSLNTPLLKETKLDFIINLIKPFEKSLDIKVIKENNRFYIEDKNGKLEAHLVAEGVRKLASIMYLIMNGELERNSVLFWDEPEANLNPALIKVVADFIILLAENDIQVFVATHDYLLTHLLSLRAEYRYIDSCPDIKFFGLTKEKDEISIEEGDTLIALNNNPILDEYAAYYDLEQEYSNKSFKLLNK